ncbi:MAG: hypothetical protein GY845_16785 [Planctomycetes bacterium]|nr:hypothetical protein [Planctomycetota bacterium]
MQTRLNFDPTSSIGNVGSVSALDTTLLPRHCWYHVKEAFSPSLVVHAIKNSQCKDKDLIVDVFSGSGTVPLESAIQGYPSVGFEVNPFLAFVSQTKLLHCLPEEIDGILKKVVDGARQGIVSPLEEFSTFSKAGGASKWLFNTAVLRAFEGAWQVTADKSETIRDVTQLCLIGAALDVCNAVKDGKCLRYRKDWDTRNFGKKDFIASLKSRMNTIKQDLKKCPLPNSDTVIHLADSRNLTSSTLSQKFKLCVMSPPYLNSFDYTDVYRPELFLGKFVTSHEELQALRLKTLRSHMQIKWADPQDLDFGPHFSESFTEIKDRVATLWNKRIPDMIQAYFEDMKHILTNLKHLAESDAQVWIVISTSAYAGVEIPVDLIIADIGVQVGWFLRDVHVARHLRRVPGQQWAELSKRKNNRPYLRESIIVLDAKPRKRRKYKK